MATKDDEPQQPPLHILFFPFPAPGHLIPMADMAALFAARGATCTILTTPVNAAIIRPAVDRANAHGAVIEISVVPFPCVGLPPGFENATGLTDQADRDKFARAIHLLREPFQQFLADNKRNHPVDAVVSDSQFQWSVDAAAEHGVPRIAFLGTSMFARACTDVMLRENPMTEGPSPDQDDPDATMVLLPGLPHRVELRRSQMPDPRTQAKVIAFFKVVNEQDQRSYGELFNSFHELEPEYVEHYRATLGRRVWLVGPVARPHNMDARSRNNNSTLSPDADDGCLRWLDGKPAGSVVYVSFGTLSNFSPDELHELARGLDLSVRCFLWVIGTGAITNAAPSSEWMPEGFAELLARGERGLVVRGWAPQVLVLNHPAIGGFVTHCGWNSVLEAVSAGVPMVTWPRCGDQFFNEKLVVEVLKVGASVGAKDYASAIETHEVIGGEVVAESIGRVMDDDAGDTIRSNAKELGAKSRRAVENGGSSYGDVGRLMEELMARRS